MAELEAELRQGLQALQLELSEQQIQQLLDYLALLQKWNKVYNLTAVRDPHEMLTHHMLDSLAAVAPLQRHVQQAQAHSLLDVGSGGGLPGVVFAICLPQLQVHCVDTVGKKAAFVQQAAGSLKLANLRGIHARVEQLREQYDVVSCRAFASLPDFCKWSVATLKTEGVWLAMKGKEPVDELAALPAEVDVFHVEQLQVPLLDAQRCIVWMRKKTAEI